MQSVNNGAIEERESMSNMTEQMGGCPQLRPGAELLEVSEDKLHISFANYTVTFTTPVVTGIVKDLLAAMEHGGCQDEVINRVATHGNLEPGLVGYVFEMLVSSHCLYWSDPKGTSKTDNDALGDFFASIGEDPELPKRVLEAARPLVLTSDASERILAEGFSASGICAEVVHFVPGTPIACVADQIKQRLTSDISMIVSWDLSYRSPAARIINEIAMSGVPVLFGACEGLIGRIGPYVLPRSTPCLECLNSRLLTHGGAEEFSFVTNYRLFHNMWYKPRARHILSSYGLWLDFLYWNWLRFC